MQYPLPNGPRALAARVIDCASATRALLLTGLLTAAGMTAAYAAPPAARGQAATVDGELEVLVEDYPDGSSRTRHYLKTDHGRVELSFRGKPTHALSGSKVRVRGQLVGDTLALDDGSSTNVEVVQAALPYTMGEQRTAILLVNFQDNTTQPITASSAHSLVFSSVNNFYKEASFQQTWLAGNTFGYFTLPISKSTCDQYLLSGEADKAAAAAGIDLSGYERKIYMFPKNACGWSGLGNVGGSVTRAWINGSFSLQVVGHELGHNQGLSHAHSRDCGNVTLGSSCTVSDYGDVADIMGAVRVGHFSPFQKELMGWLNDGTSPPIHTASASGRYFIEPYSSQSTGYKAIKIKRGTDSATGKALYYYLEYRQPIGADASMGTVGNLTKGVLVRLAKEGDRYSSDLLDNTPASQSGTTSDFQDGALAAGQSYSESAAGITIRVAWADSTGAAVDVTLGGSTATCTRAAPTLSLTGGSSSVAAGSTVGYTVKLTNNDSSACSASSFSLSRVVPSGWTGTLAATSLSVSPGSSASTTLNVTSPSTTVAGTYSLSASASGTSGSASASGTYTVGAPVSLSETVSTNKSTYSAGETVSMTARVLNGTTPVAGASVAFRVTKPNGQVATLSATTGSTGYAYASLTLNKRKDPTGSYALRADASYSGKAVSASTAFGVTGTSGGTGNKGGGKGKQ